MSEVVPGQRIDDFEILDIAGHGGMGVVYRARQVSLERIVAIKLIATAITAEPDYLARFAREARVAAAIVHPHVVTVHGAGRHGARPYIVMQWVDGSDLRTLIDDHGAMEPKRACLIAAQLGSALDAVHECGLLHRDLKPANVLLQQLRRRDHVYLTDFGIAKFLQPEATPLTKTGHAIGTAGYIAPECIRGADADSRSDIYAMGCVLFECFSGERTFAAGNEMAMSWAHANNPRPKLSERRPQLGRRFDAILARALAIAPQERFGSGVEFADALETALSASVRAPAGAPTVTPPSATGWATATTPPRPSPPETVRPPATSEGIPTRSTPPATITTPADPPGPSRRHARPGARAAVMFVLAGLVLGALVATGALSKLNGATSSPDEDRASSSTSTTRGTNAGSPAGEKADNKIEPVAGAEGISLSVGSKNFTEQFILGEIYAQALLAAGYKVKKDLNLGSESIAFRALRRGAVDAYPEYTGTSLTEFFNVSITDVPRDSTQAYEAARTAYTKVGITALAPTPFQDTYALAITQTKSDELGNPTKISDLADKAADLTINGFAECRQRIDCLPGVQQTYGFKFKEFLPGEQKFQILDNGDADVAFVFTTDGPLSSGKYVALEDDKNAFPPYNVSFTIRDEAAKKLGAEGQKVVTDVQRHLTTEVMQKLNQRVDVDGERPASVARGYLESFGYTS